MDDAGKQANAPKETAGGRPTPPRAVASVSKRSAQLLQDHSLLTSSVWCGLVFSLALVLTAINLLPPAPVGYRVSTKLFASVQRLHVLKRQQLTHAVAPPDSASAEPHLLGIQVLDGQAFDGPSKTAPAQPTASNEDLMLIEVRSLWPARTSSDQVHQWLNKLSKPDRRTLVKIDSANAERFARWQREAAQHYLEHFRHTRRSGAHKQAHNEADKEADKQALSKSHSAGTLVSAADGLPARFASLATAPAETTSPKPATIDDIEDQLVQDFQRATAREKSAAAAVQEQALKLSGILTLAGSPHVRAQPGRVPSAMVLSILVLALAGGAVGGWAHHRAQSGGIFHAAEVARSMDQFGLPSLGILRVAGSNLQAAGGRVQQRVTSFRRWAVKQSLALTELVVLFWCLAIAMRVVLDPLWRGMLCDNPLAALGRLLTGLP